MKYNEVNEIKMKKSEGVYRRKKRRRLDRAPKPRKSQETATEAATARGEDYLEGIPLPPAVSKALSYLLFSNAERKPMGQVNEAYW